MSEKLTFEEYKKQLDEIKGKKQKLARIFSDIGCTFPVFYGNIKRVLNYAGDTFNDFIINIGQIGNGERIDYPYKHQMAIRAFIQKPHGRDLREGEIALFTLRLGAMRSEAELFCVDKIVMARDVFGDDTDFGSIDLSDFSVIHKIVSALSPLGIASLDEAVVKYDQASEKIEALRESVDECGESIKEFSDLKNAVGDPEKFRELTVNVKEAVDSWNNADIPSESELEARSKELELIGKQAENTLSVIKNCRNELVGFHDDFVTAFPYADDSFDIDNLNADSVKKLSTRTIADVLSRAKYSYNKDKVAMFLSALGTSQIIALCGKPGTGKTTFAEQMANSIGAVFHLIEVQNNWTDRSDILGFYNPTNGSYQSTDFLEAILSAKNEYERNSKNNKENKTRLHIICLDEMNLSRVEYYFATFLSLLQRPDDERRLTLLPRDVELMLNDKTDDSPENVLLRRYRSFILPPNVRFVGTMNMDDTAQFLSPKVIDRSIFLEFDAGDECGLNPDCDKNMVFYPCTEFNTLEGEDKEIREMLKAVSEEGVFTPGNRLNDYSMRMWRIYSRLYTASKLSKKDFIDLVILEKVLPSLTKRFAANQSSEAPKLSDYGRSIKRYQRGIGDSANKFDSQSWSFWS